MPWLGWALLAADALGGAARGISDEAARSRMDQSHWHRDAHAAVRAEIEQLHTALRASLTDAAATARTAIETELTGALAAAAAADHQLRSYRHLLRRLEAATHRVDLMLARRLASLCGIAPQTITRAERTPGSNFRIWRRPVSPAKTSWPTPSGPACAKPLPCTARPVHN